MMVFFDEWLEEKHPETADWLVESKWFKGASDPERQRIHNPIKTQQTVLENKERNNAERQ
jgi:6-phosphogluconolactonase/glucosamine-6-phosphate isomerase/deaminase